MSAQKLAQVLEEIIVKRVREDTLAVPSLPDLAFRCLALLRETDVDLREVVALIQKDPVIAARVLRQASSAAVGTGSVPSLQQGVTRLGASVVRRLIVEVSVRELFQSRDPRIAASAAALWSHSLAVAILSRDLAAVTGQPDPEAAYVAGLVHDVGKPIAASMLLELERVSRPADWKLTPESWMEAVQGVHRRIGVALAEKWRLPEQVASAIRDSSEYDTVNRESLANVVCFANGIAKVHGLFPGRFDETEAEATVMIGRSLFGIEDDVIARLAASVKERVTTDA